jgi:S1-C subfamily serine protease
MMLCHLTGSLRGRTQYLDTDSISFGIGEGCGVVFDSDQDSAVCPVHAELTVEDHGPIIRDRSGRDALFVNGQRRTEADLHDGDLIQFGEDGPLVRFRIHPDAAPETKPWRQIVTDCRDIVVRTPHPRYLSPLYLARHLLTDMARYGSPAVKLAAVTAILAPVLLIAALTLALYRQYQATSASERQRAELVRQLETGRLTLMELERRIEQERLSADELRRQQDELVQRLTAALTQQEAARRSQQELQAIRRQLAELQGAQRFAEELASRFQSGVGLLQGGYGFKEKGTGRPLRYQGFDRLGNPYVDKDGNTLVTVEGTTPPVVIFYAGTGFLVDRQGTIATNRHLVRMWEVYEPAKEAIRAGFEPHLYLLRIFFPGTPAPYDLRLVAASEQVDLAVLRTDRAPTGSTPLPLAPHGDTPHVGEPVVVLSYPGSFDSLLGRLAGPVSEEILREAGADPAKLAERLAGRKLIRPLATQGHVADSSAEAITFEAASASGSSGGPVLDRAGRVVAVNRAVLHKVGQLNVGLPVRFVHDLLGGTDAAGPRAGS